MAICAELFLLSAATLAFEINLTRLFSVAQFYHFAFMIVSLALLGFGASGTLLAILPRLRQRDPARTLILLGWGFALTAVGSYVLTLYIPFDSFRIAHDWRQGLVLALHYLALATPFLCSGAAIGLLLAVQPERANYTYAANLTGSAAGCLLAALPYRLRPGARVLALEPRGGFDVLVALAEGARTVTAVEANPLIVAAVQEQGAWAGDLYDDPRVTVVQEEGRAYARRARERYDVIVLSLTTPQRTVASGAYSLAEDYRYTVEAFADYLARLDEGGLLVVTRWLQVPPSEEVRAFALAVEALAQSGGDPRASIVALRSYQQTLILVRRGPFTAEELATVRAFAAPRAFDLVYLPDVRSDEVNRYNVMPEPDYTRACIGLLETQDRAAWYRAYPFDVSPPTDDRPFFGHFFRWGQAREVLALAGHTWQPFGGAGYFVLLALLTLVERGDWSAIKGRWAALRHLRSVWQKRRAIQTHIRDSSWTGLMQPVEGPWRVLRRYRHLRPGSGRENEQTG